MTLKTKYLTHLPLPLFQWNFNLFKQLYWNCNQYFLKETNIDFKNQRKNKEHGTVWFDKFENDHLHSIFILKPSKYLNPKNCSLEIIQKIE
jgi:hypothetical protein